MSKTDVTKNRLALFSTINGDSFYGVRLWPNKYVKLFWQKPITEASTFQLFLFLVGNGCSPHLSTEWILLSQYWHTEALMKRFNQLKYIINHYEDYSDTWFYFDLHMKVYRHIYGKQRPLHETT